MAYTAWSVTTGETPSASKWNQLGANDAGFKDGTLIDPSTITPEKLLSGTGTSWAWQSYTPTITSGGGSPTIGNGTIVGRYQQIGKTVHFSIEVTNGSTTNFGTGSTSFSLPVTASSSIPNRVPICFGEYLDASPAGSYILIGYRNGTTAVVIQTLATGGAIAGYGAFDNTSPTTQATSDKTVIYGSYEAA